MKLDKKKVIAILTEKKATRPCHRCGNVNFSLLDGYSNFNLQENLTGALVLGGPTVPVVHIACNNCGVISSHAIGALGLLKKKEEEEEEEGSKKQEVSVND